MSPSATATRQSSSATSSDDLDAVLPLINEPYKTLMPYVPGKPVSETERELGISGCVKLASNENPMGPSPKAVAAMQQAVASVHDYPDGGAFYLKQALAARHSVSPDQIIVGNGTNEVIELIIRTCMRPGDNLIYAQQSFIVYRLCAMAMGCEIRDVPLTAHQCFDLPAIAKAMDARTKLVFIANPNNPTGTVVSKQAFDDFLAAIPQHVLVVLDEAYHEYVREPDTPNGFDYLAQRERFMVLRTFSKAYGLAGVRVGYGVGQVPLIEATNRGREPFNVNSLGQVAALAALDDHAHIEASAAMNHREMDALTPALESRDLGVTPSQANFLLVDFKRDAKAMFEGLLRQGVIVRPMAGYGLPTSARITIGTPEQNQKLLAALDVVLPKVPQEQGA